MSESVDDQFRCRRQPSGTDREHVVAVGEIDVASSPQLAAVLRDAQTNARCVVLDLGRTTFIDAGGVRVLLAADARARARADSFSVACPTSAVWRLMRLVGADRTLRTNPVLDFPQRAGAADGSRVDSPPTGGARPAVSAPLLPLPHV